MNNCSLHSKFSALCWAQSGLLFVALLTMGALQGFDLGLVVFLVIGVALAFRAQMDGRYERVAHMQGLHGGGAPTTLCWQARQVIPGRR